MKVLITGNRTKDLTKHVAKLLEDSSYEVDTVSRSNGWDLGNTEVIPDFINLLDKYDIFVNMFANWRFNASLLTYYVFQDWQKKKAYHSLCHHCSCKKKSTFHQMILNQSVH